MRGIFYILVITLVFTGCENKDNKFETMRIGNTVWPGYEPLYLGQEKGIIDRKYIHFVEYISTSQVLRAFKNKHIEAAALTLYDALLLREYGMNFSIVLVLDISYGGDVILTQNMHKNLGSLKGKTIGLENTSMGIHLLSRALEKNGMTLKDVKMKTFEGYEHEKAFKNKEVDAVVTYEPMRSTLMKYGANEVFTSKEMPNEIIDVLIVQNDYLKKHPKQVKNLINNWYKTLEYYKSNQEESNIFLSKRLKLNPKDVPSAFHGLILPTKQENLKLLNSKDSQIIKVSKTIEKLTSPDKAQSNECQVEILLDYDLSTIYDIEKII